MSASELDPGRLLPWPADMQAAGRCDRDKQSFFASRASISASTLSRRPCTDLKTGWSAASPQRSTIIDRPMLQASAAISYEDELDNSGRFGHQRLVDVGDAEFLTKPNDPFGL